METGHHSKNAAVETPGLGERLELCADKLGSKKALGDAAGISQAQLFRYIRGESEIPAAKALHVARVAKVDPTWLLSGDGKPEGFVVPRRPEFRPELLRQLSQVLDEVLIEYPQRIAPRQKSRFLAFMYEAVRHEEIRSGRHWEPGRGLMVNYLDFLCGFKDEESLSLYERFAKHAMYGEGMALPLNEQDAVAQAIAASYQHYFNATSGETIYRRFTQKVNAGTAEQLQHMVARIRQKYGTGKLKLLDLGSGTGRGLLYLHQIDPRLELHGLEQSQRGFKLCQSLEKAGQLPEGCVQLGDFQLIPHGNEAFDVLYSRQSIYSLPLLESTSMGMRKFMHECARVLKPGGMMLLKTFAGDGGVLLPFCQLLSPQDFETTALEAGLKVKESQVIDLVQFIQQAGFKQSVPSGFEKEITVTLVKA
jgi:SAM-dependent methyltransferase/transcriptional regulator with XRE-family HTH domain